MGFIADNYGIEQTSPLMTDKYHITTAYAYWQEGRAENRAVSYAFGRKPAHGAGYTVAAGLEGIIDIVKRWQEHGFTAADIACLRAQKTTTGVRQFPDAFIDYLARMTFNLKIDAAPEGAVVFPQEPVLRIEGPIVQVKMLESVALCLLNGHSAYATHAAHLTDALEQDLPNGSPKGVASVQGLRRGPSLGAAIEASRSLELAGYRSTSTGTAAKVFGQDFAGTMDHAWVMTHESEIAAKTMADLFALRDAGKTDELKAALSADAFRSYAFSYPDAGVLLVDTYDPVQGLENAITVIKELRAAGRGAAYGVRFDSGDIVAYSRLALRRFGLAGFIDGLAPVAVEKMTDDELLKHADRCSVFCAAADGIDAYSAKDMRAAGACYTAWGIGTGGSHVPPLGMVYKASSFAMDDTGAMTPVMKVAHNAPVKSSNPGRINARRFYGADGKIKYTVIYDEDSGFAADHKMVNLRRFSDVAQNDPQLWHKDLLVPVFDDTGRYVYPPQPARASFAAAGAQTTDLSALRDFVAREKNTLPDYVRNIEKPRDVVLKEKLLAAYNAALAAGRHTVDIAAIEKNLPPVRQELPVYLDAKLYEQRVKCEEKHLGRSNKSGVDAYRERFDGAAVVQHKGPKK